MSWVLLACNAQRVCPLVWNENKVTSREGVVSQCDRRQDRYSQGSTNPGIELNTSIVAYCIRMSEITKLESLRKIVKELKSVWLALNNISYVSQNNENYYKHFNEGILTQV
jgi:hypothetical protein